MKRKKMNCRALLCLAAPAFAFVMTGEFASEGREWTFHSRPLSDIARVLQGKMRLGVPPGDFRELSFLERKLVRSCQKIHK